MARSDAAGEEFFKCLVCNHRLNRREEIKDGKIVAVVYQHAYYHDHPAVPIAEADHSVPVTGVCDFCGDEAPPLVYVRSIPFMVVLGKDVHHDSGEWNACKECALLWDPEDLSPLAARVRVRMKANRDPGSSVTDQDIDNGIDFFLETIWKVVAENYIGMVPTHGVV